MQNEARRGVDGARDRRTEQCQSGFRPQQLQTGGWVNDSEPEAEFQETVNKSEAMLKAIALAKDFTLKA